MNLEIILHAGLATGTVLLFASIGELLAERSGILNLGVEGMMLIGAMTGFSMSLATGNPWLGLLLAMLAAGILSLAHGVVTISFNDLGWITRLIASCGTSAVALEPPALVEAVRARLAAVVAGGR